MSSVTTFRLWIAGSFSLLLILVAVVVAPVSPSALVWFAIGLTAGFLTARG